MKETTKMSSGEFILSAQLSFILTNEIFLALNTFSVVYARDKS